MEKMVIYNHEQKKGNPTLMSLQVVLDQESTGRQDVFYCLAMQWKG